MAKAAGELMDNDGALMTMADTARDHMLEAFPIVREVRQLAQVYADVSDRQLSDLFREEGK